MKSINDPQRIVALHAYGILDTPREASFDALTRIAAYVCGAPIAVINFIDQERQWFKSEIGLGVQQTPLDTSICAHVILQAGLCVVPDTQQDPRFIENPLVLNEPNLRFYAGAVLEDEEGNTLGTLCVLDHAPRPDGLTPAQGDILLALAGQVMQLLKLYRHNRQQAEMLAEIDAARRQMAHLASTDALTGLANRRSFSERLSQEIAQLSRSGRRSCLILADLDHFKKINDEHGHQAGDEALRVFAATCKSVFRAADVIGRWGGEEFVMLLPDTTVDDALSVTQRLHDAQARTPINGNGRSFRVSVSIGLVEMDDSRSMDALLHEADEALYAAKEGGRSRTVAA